MARMTRGDYAQMYGPTTGDAVRLGDTSLLAEVEHDFGVPGDEKDREDDPQDPMGAPPHTAAGCVTGWRLLCHLFSLCRAGFKGAPFRGPLPASLPPGA